MAVNRRRYTPEPADEIIVKDGHLTIKLKRLEDCWLAEIESEFEGKIFSGPVTEMSELIVNNSMVNAFISTTNLGELNG